MGNLNASGERDQRDKLRNILSVQKSQLNKGLTALKCTLLVVISLVWFGLFSLPGFAENVIYDNGENDATNYTLTESQQFNTSFGGPIIAEQSGNIDFSSLCACTANFNIFGIGDRLTFSGDISGNGLLVKRRPGTLILTGNNTIFNGGNSVVIFEGTIIALSNTALGPGRFTSGGFQSVSRILDLGNVTLANGLVISGDLLITMNSGSTAEISGAVSLDLGNTLNLEPTDPGDVLTLSGIISGSGSLIKTGLGRLILSGSNTFSGGLVLQGGNLTLATDTAAGTGSISVTTSGRLIELLGNVTIANDIHFQNVQGIIRTQSGPGTVNGDITLGSGSNGIVFFEPIFSFAPLTINGDVSGVGLMSKRGAGTLILTGNNTNVNLSGQSFIFFGGTIHALSNTALGAGSVSVNSSQNQVLDLGNVTLANDFDITTDLLISMINGSTAELAGAISLFNAGDILTLEATGPGDVLTLSGIISGEGSLAKTGPGLLTLSGANTFTGGLTLNAGTLQLLSTGTISGSVRGVTVEGDGTTITNSGLIEGLGTASSSSTADAAIKLGAADGTVINNLPGGVITGTTFGIVSAPEDVAINTTINNQGTIIGVNNDGIRLIGGGTIINSGTISGSDPLGLGGSAGDGVSAFNWFSSTPVDPSVGVALLDNQLGGTITGDRYGVIFSGGGTVLNAGTISGGIGGVLIQSGNSITPSQFAFLTNSGTIITTNVAPGPFDLGGAVALGVGIDGSLVTNSGLIQGNFDGIRTFSSLNLVNTATGVITGDFDDNGTGAAIRTAVAGEEVIGGPSQNFADFIQNDGTINGDVILGVHNDTLINNGFIVGTIDLGENNDFLDNQGFIVGTVDLGHGRDLLINNGTINGSVFLGSFPDVLIINGGSITGVIDGGEGSDSVVWGVPGGSSEMVDGSVFTNFENFSVLSGNTANLFFSGAMPFTTFAVSGPDSILTIFSPVNIGPNADIAFFNGGTLNIEGDQLPGSSIGTLNMTGKVTFRSGGGIYHVDISSNGDSDLINVDGNIFLTFNPQVFVSVLDTPPNKGITDFTIMTATGFISGSFVGVSTDNNTFLPILVQSSNEIILRLGKIGSVFKSVGGSGNQKEIAGLLDQLAPGEITGVQTIIELFMSLGSEAGQQAFLDQIAGGSISDLDNNSLSTTSGTNFNINAHLNEARKKGPRVFTAQCFKSCYRSGYRSASLAGFDSHTVPLGNGSSWFQSHVSMGAFGSSPGYINPNNTYGLSSSFEGGFDTWIGSNILMGFSYGFLKTRDKAFTSSIQGEAEYSHIGTYLAANLPGQFYTNNILTVTFGEMDANRNYEVGDFSFSPRLEVNSQTVSIYSEVGRDMNILGFEAQPFVSFQYTNTQRDPLRENGILDLIFDQDNLTSIHGSLGFRFNRTFEDVLGLTIKPSAHFRFIHEFGNAKLLRPTFVQVSGFGGRATIFNQPGFENAFIVGAGLEFSKGGHIRFALDYDGFYSGDYRIQSMTGRLLWGF